MLVVYRAKTVNNIDEDEAILSDVDSSYDEIYYQNQNTEPKFGEKVQSEYLMKLIGSYGIYNLLFLIRKINNSSILSPSLYIDWLQQDFCHFRSQYSGTALDGAQRHKLRWWRIYRKWISAITWVSRNITWIITWGVRKMHS